MRSRREFLATATGCVAHLVLNAACAPRGTRARWTAPRQPTVITTPFARLDAIARDTWALISTPLGGDRTTFANGGIIAGRTGVVVVEGFYRAAGAEWVAQQARALTGRWPTHVVVTHYHVDHASGIPGFAADGQRAPQLYATDLTRTAALSGSAVAPQRTDALVRAYADVVIVPASGGTRIDLGDREVLIEPTRGHTASDLVVRDEAAGVTYSGDLVWNGMFPNFVDALPSAWAANAARLAAHVRARPASVLVPGHGGVADAAAMARYRGLLDDIEQVARTGHAAGRTAADTAATFSVPPSLGEWMASRPAVERAMAAWWRELGAR
jgi:glyoxylase-like metal-dependent hydrolase (beta-lactamase superfamily II)